MNFTNKLTAQLNYPLKLAPTFMDLPINLEFIADCGNYRAVQTQYRLSLNWEMSVYSDTKEHTALIKRQMIAMLNQAIYGDFKNKLQQALFLLTHKEYEKASNIIKEVVLDMEYIEK